MKKVSEQQWKAGYFKPMLDHARLIGTQRQFRLIHCGLCRWMADHLLDDDHRTALVLAERYTDGEIEYGNLIPHRIQLETSERGVNAAFGHVEEVFQSLLTVLCLDDCELPIFSDRNGQVLLLRDIFGNPFRPVAFDPAWRTSDSTGIAAKMYETRNYSAMPILADALEEAGCDSVDILLHCREPGMHVRGRWVVDLVLGKQ